MALFPTNATQVQQFAGALYGVQIGSTTLAQVTSDIQAAGGLSNALNAYYAANGTTNVQLGVATNAAAGVTATGGFTVASLVLNGITNTNLSSLGSNAGANVITAMTNPDNSLFTITGNNDLTMALAAGTSLGARVNASAFTGKLSIVGSQQNDVIIGGSGNDTLQIGTGTTGQIANEADTLTGGAGADTFKFVEPYDTAASVAKLLAQSAGTTAIVKITDFVAGTDKIHLSYSGTALTGPSMTVNTAQTIATAADLTAVYAGITAISASTTAGAFQSAVVTVSAGAAAGTYLYINDATGAVSNSADMLINITGLTGVITASDFVFA